MSKILIPEPCHEDWDNMTATQQGRHCQKCEKTVHDVSHISNDEVHKRFELLGGNMCLRIPKERTTASPKHVNWKSIFVAVVLSIWLSIQNFVAKAQDTLSDSTEKDNNKVIAQCLISGVVLDSLNDGSPMPFALIEVHLDNEKVFRSYSDTLGRFRIEINTELKENDSLNISCTMLGYKKIERKSSVRDSIDVEFFLQENHACLNEVVIAIERDKQIIKGGMSGIIMMGIPVRRTPNLKVYRKHVHGYNGTKTYYSDDIEKYNLGR
ncbi:MAG: hypothetical protein ACPGTP_01870 [Bacteroidia bacterium]